MKRNIAASEEGLRAIAIPPPLMPAVVMADAMARRLDGVRRRPEPTLRIRAPFGQVSGKHSVVSVDVEVVGLLHEGEALVVPFGKAALAASQLDAASVEPYVAVFVLHEVISVVAVHKLLFEQAVGLFLRLEPCL